MTKGGKERMIELKRYDKNTVPWSAKQLVKSMDNGTAKFDNAVQRSLVWTKEQKSLFIHSMIINAPIPPMYASKKNKVYDFMDGKQRSNCIHSFFNDQFRLEDIPITYDADGNEIDYNGFLFSELPADIQDYIKDYSLVIYSFDDLDPEDFADIFYRLNSGSILKPIDKNLAKMPSLPYVVQISNHPIFEEALTKRAVELRTDKDIVIKSLMMIKETEPALDAKEIKSFTRTIELNDNDVKHLNKIYDIILDISTQIKDSEVHKYDPIKNSIIARRILGRSHIVTLVPFIEKHMDEDILYLRDFLWKFYSGENKASIVGAYNDASTQGSGHKENVHRRQMALEKEWERFKK